MAGTDGWLAATLREELASMGARRHLPAGATVFSEGDEPSEVLLIERGTVKLTTTSLDGRELVLDVLSAPTLLGELSTIDGSPRSATATALHPVVVVAVHTDRFLAFLDAHPAAMRSLVEVLIARLRQANRRQLEYATSDALGRLCARLAELAAREGTPGEDGVRLQLPFTQTELAQWCGLSREAVVKALRKLRELGWIETGESSVRIVDVESLRARGSV